MKHLKRLATIALALMVSTIMYAQKVEVSGTVVDQTGETIMAPQSWRKVRRTVQLPISTETLN